MALINCPECRKQISDTADTCPHCGKEREIGGGEATANIFGYIILCVIMYFVLTKIVYPLMS